MISHKERYMKAVHHEEPDTVPVCCWLDSIHVQRISGQTIPDVSLFAARPSGEVEVDMAQISLRYSVGMIEAVRRLGLDSLIIADYLLFPRGFKPRFLDNTRYVDHLGRIMSVRSDVDTTYWVDGVVHTEEDFDRFILPDPDDLSYDPIDLAVKEAADEYPVLGWWHAGEMFSFEVRGGIDRMVHDLYRNPEFAKRLVKKVSDYQFNVAKQIMDRGVDIMVEADDYADSKSTFYPPRIIREFFLPYVKRFVDECHRRNILVMKHSDGNLYPIIDDLVNLGIDGLHPIEPGVMDLADVKNRYGERIFLRGNVDCAHTLPYGTEEDVRRDVRRCIDSAAQGGGYVLSESNSMHSNVKTENIGIMVDEARKYGHYRKR